MTQEEKLRMLKEAGVFVAGDMVLEKNVEYEVNNVEQGGIGIQVNHYHGKQEEEWPSDLRRTQKTFKANVDNKRLEKLYMLLLKLNYVPNNTTPKEVLDVFSGEISDCVIRWMLPQATLWYFIKTLTDKGFITTEDNEPWIIVRNHFRDKDNQFFGDDIRKSKTPRKYKAQLDRLIQILNPKESIYDGMSIEDFKDTIDMHKDSVSITNRRHY